MSARVIVEADGGCSEAAVFEAGAEKCEGAFVFLPGEDVAVAGERAGCEKRVCA